MRVSLLRAVGAVTAGYGVAVAARPELLAWPSGLVDERGRTAPATRASLGPVGLRDAVSGLALVLAPRGPALVTAGVVRAAADVGDAVLLGRTLPGAARRRAAVAVSVGWGALTVAGLLAPARRRARRRAGRRSEPSDARSASRPDARRGGRRTERPAEPPVS